MIPCVYIPLDRAPPVALYESDDRRQAAWLLPIETDAGPVFLQHILTLTEQDTFCRYGIARHGKAIAVVYTGPYELPAAALDSVLPEMVRSALHDESNPIFGVSHVDRPHLIHP